MMNASREPIPQGSIERGRKENARQAALIEKAGGIVAYMTGPTFPKEAATTTKKR